MLAGEYVAAENAHLNSEGGWLGISYFKTSWDFFVHFQNNLALTCKDEEVNQTDNSPFRFKMIIPWGRDSFIQCAQHKQIKAVIYGESNLLQSL